MTVFDRVDATYDPKRKVSKGLEALRGRRGIFEALWVEGGKRMFRLPEEWFDVECEELVVPQDDLVIHAVLPQREGGTACSV